MGNSIWVRNMEQEEKYLGGFYSALQLALGRWQVGLGIYFTDRRVFLVQRDRFELDKIVTDISISSQRLERSGKSKSGKKLEYERLVRLLQAFNAEALKIL